MSDIAIEITNLSEIKAAFGKAPRLMTTGLNKAIKKTILNIQAGSMRNTPVQTGRLRASHRSLFDNLRGQVGTNTNYDVFVHEGTRNMEARPYLALAVDDSQSDTEKFFTEAVDEVLHEIGRSI